MWNGSKESRETINYLYKFTGDLLPNYKRLKIILWLFKQFKTQYYLGVLHATLPHTVHAALYSMWELVIPLLIVVRNLCNPLSSTFLGCVVLGIEKQNWWSIDTPITIFDRIIVDKWDAPMKPWLQLLLLALLKIDLQNGSQKTFSNLLFTCAENRLKS